MNTIRNYRNTVSLNFEQRGEKFTLDVPHYKKWLEVIKFLQKRGFVINKNNYYEKNYKSLSKFHKIGFKNDVACLLEIGSRNINIEFGNIQNLWKDMPQSFWSSKSDDRYTHLSYLEDKAVELEIYKLMEFCKKYNHVLYIEDNKLSVVDLIIKENNSNSHIHGKITCLEDIGKPITPDSYNYKSNSDDKNKKKIICGDLKYFYDWQTKRLGCGIAIHHINNMWWLLFGKQRRNIVCWDLFDYEPGLPRRKPVEEGKVNKLLEFYQNKRDYKKCQAIYDFHSNVLK
jgi:hypothetical protein